MENLSPRNTSLSNNPSVVKFSPNTPMDKELACGVRVRTRKLVINSVSHACKPLSRGRVGQRFVSRWSAARKQSTYAGRHGRSCLSANETSSRLIVNDAVAQTLLSVLSSRDMVPQACLEQRRRAVLPSLAFGIWWTRGDSGDSNPRPPRCERGK